MKPETRSFYQRAVQAAAERVAQGLDEALDLGRLARGVALSPFHFHRIFRGMVGETPLELHRRLRMERAAWSLLHHGDSVTAIAFQAGYDTHEAFTRAFRERYGCPPSEFRRRGRRDAIGCEGPSRIEVAARSGIHYRPDRPEPLTIHFLHGEQAMDVGIEEMKELRVATVPHVGPYNRIGQAFARLGEIAGRSGLIGPGSMMLAIYHDDPETTAEDELRSEAAVSVPRDLDLPGSLDERRIPAGRYAHTTHVGAYEELGDVWARFMGQWLPESGHRFGDGVAYEVYHNTPGEVPKEELRTDLYMPLA